MQNFDDRVREYLKKIRDKYGPHPLGHAYIWCTTIGGQRFLAGGVCSANIQGLCDDLKNKFPTLKYVSYNLD